MTLRPFSFSAALDTFMCCPSAAIVSVLLLAQVAGAQVIDTVTVRAPSKLGGSESCVLGRQKTLPSDSKNLKLHFQLAGNDTAASRKADEDVAFYLDNRRFAIIPRGASSVDTTVKMADGAGKVVAATLWSGNTLLCTALTRELPKKTDADSTPTLRKDDAFFLRTGVEYSSADGFRNKTLRAPVEAGWTIDFGEAIPGRHAVRIDSTAKVIGNQTIVRVDSMIDNGTLGWRAFPYRFALTTLLDITSIIKTQSFDRCDAVTTTVRLAKTDPTPSATAGSCAGATRIERLPGDTLARITTYAAAFDGVRSDTTAATAGTVRLTTLLRFEFTHSDSHIFVGPAGWVGFETNPNSSRHSLGYILRGGLSVRQLAEDGHERGGLVLLYGKADFFPTVTSRVFSHPASTTDTVFVEQTVPASTPIMETNLWTVRASFAPTDGVSVRAFVNYLRSQPFSPTGRQNLPTIATIAVMKTLDLSPALKAIGLDLK